MCVCMCVRVCVGVGEIGHHWCQPLLEQIVSFCQSSTWEQHSMDFKSTRLDGLWYKPKIESDRLMQCSHFK